MDTEIQLVVGLGNPGGEYARTRHNAGFWYVDALAGRLGISFRDARDFRGQAGRARRGDSEVWLFKPMTFMNRSGSSVQAIAHYYRIPLGAILVAHDELDLPPGSVRLKQGGGHGGHNGMRDLLDGLGDGGFWRLRLGIGHPGSRELVTPYVLNRPSAEDEQAISGAIERALDVSERLLDGDFQKVMNDLHRRQE